MYEVHDGVVGDVAWHLRHEYLFGSVGDDHESLIWDMRTPTTKKLRQSVAAHDAELEELFDFLSSPSTQLKKAAVDIVCGLTGSDDGMVTLVARADLALPRLMRLLREPSELAAPVAESLINLSQNATLVDPLVSLGAIPTAMDILHKQPELIRLVLMLVANLTQVDSGVTTLFQAQVLCIGCDEAAS